ncbi:MAG TPA: DegT/DnrJ/EryC1/StrS family aminotransferase [Candidatus Sulfotelmatobacter sp.]|jgi:dTDP-4-amino-4,6-dideoxygalactose transaminase|nr:DegT/DnrJ/EryC1/StrS family aminotransferase [Candidatus Sulfotelmatobacter sp.]
MSEATHTPTKIPQMHPGAFFEQHRAEIMAAVNRVFESGWYILGEEVKAFEQEFARRFCFGGAVGVGNGTDAIVLALRALGVGEGDRVATVSHTAVATVAAIEMARASPVLVDINADSYTMDPASLLRTLEARAPIKAVIAVHLYGHPADIHTIVEIAHRFNAPVIEDCAQAHGAKLNERFVGNIGDIATFSFYPTKNLGAFGDGGMVVSSDLERIRRVRMLREYGWERRYISDVPGINSRLDELHAATLRVRLPYLDAGNQRRADIAAAYDVDLADTGLILPSKRPGATHVYHQYVVRHRDRDRLRARLKENGVGTNIHYPVPVHSQPAYAGRLEADPGGLNNTDAVATQILSLPMYPELSDAMVANVVDALRRLL